MGNMPDIKKMPIIGTIKTKALVIDIIGSQYKEPYSLRPVTYEVVETNMHNGKMYFTTNIWYKEHKRIPLIIVEDIVEIFKKVPTSKNL